MLVALTGAAFAATLDGVPLAGWWRAVAVGAGQTLALGAVDAATGGCTGGGLGWVPQVVGSSQGRGDKSEMPGQVHTAEGLGALLYPA